MNLISQVPMLCSSLQHQSLLSPWDTSTAENRFCFSKASFFLELLVIALCSSLLAYYIPSNLGGLSSSVISFHLFILFIGFSQQEYWSGLPFLPPVVHVLSELSTMTCSSWEALQGMAHNVIELHKPICHDKAVIHEGVSTFYLVWIVLQWTSTYKYLFKSLF